MPARMSSSPDAASANACTASRSASQRIRPVPGISFAIESERSIMMKRSTGTGSASAPTPMHASSPAPPPSAEPYGRPSHAALGNPPEPPLPVVEVPPLALALVPLVPLVADVPPESAAALPPFALVPPVPLPAPLAPLRPPRAAVPLPPFAPESSPPSGSALLLQPEPSARGSPTSASVAMRNGRPCMGVTSLSADGGAAVNDVDAGGAVLLELLARAAFQDHRARVRCGVVVPAGTVVGLLRYDLAVDRDVDRVEHLRRRLELYFARGDEIGGDVREYVDE